MRHINLPFTKSCKFVIITEKGGNTTKNINVNVQRPPTNIPLGRQGENLATCIIFDCTGLVQLYGDGTAELLHELKDGTVYPVAVTQEGASVSWTVSASDTAMVGAGRAELRWYVGDTLAKSAKFRTSVSSALADSTTETPPEPQKSWVDKVLAAAQEIKDGAISDDKLAAAIAAYLDEHPIDAGLDEAALAAYLVENGYLTNTELADAIAQALADAKASGEFDGAPGMDGVDGGYYTPSVDADGNLTWTASADNMPAVTGANIKGPRGDTGPQGPQGDKGDTGATGAQGPAGADGSPGADGKSAYQYAKDGGYTGTEAEFAAKLAAEMPESYTLPIASADTLGGVQPVAQTADMTQPVGVDADGKLFAPSAGGKWISIGTVTAKNDGEALVVDGFSAERIRITAMLAAVTDNKGLRFFISEDMHDKQFNLGTSLTTSLRPITFEMQIVGEYAVTSAFIYPKNVISANAINSIYIGGVQLPGGETTLKRFGVTSANDKLIAGSWLRIEVWQQ